MLGGRPKDAAGTVVVCTMEGTRPLLVEIQALVTYTSFNIPRRTAVGMDFNRVNLLLAVLEKRLGIQMGNCDAYINLTGGMKINEPAIDLGIVAAMISSFKNIIIPPDTVIFGEVGLAGEVRAVTMAEQRVKEAGKLGFKNCIIPKVNATKMKRPDGVNVVGVNYVEELVNMFG